MQSGCKKPSGQGWVGKRIGMQAACACAFRATFAYLYGVGGERARSLRRTRTEWASHVCRDGVALQGVSWLWHVGVLVG